MKNAIYFQVFFIEFLRKMALKVAIFDSECEAVLRADADCYCFSTAKRREEARRIDF